MTRHSTISALLYSLILICIGGTPMWACAGSAPWRLSSGLDFSSGKFGETDATDTLYVPVTAKFKEFPWAARLTVPYLRTEGPGVVIGGGDSAVLVDAENSGTTTERGFGDIFAAVTYSTDPVADWAPYLDFTAKMKMATADEDKLLGTGEHDYYVQIDLGRSFGELNPFATLGYQVMGDPGDIDFNNRFYCSLGIDVPMTERMNGGLVVDYKEASQDTTDAIQEAVAYLNIKKSQKWSLNLYGVTGFSDSSVDFGVGAQITRRIGADN